MDLAQARTAVTEAKWRRREQELGCQLSDEENIKLDLEEKELQVKKMEKIMKECAEILHLEKQKKRNQRDAEHGRWANNRMFAGNIRIVR